MYILYCKYCLQMTLKVFPCVHTETYVSMRLWFVVWVAVVLTPAYFASHHLLFGSWYSWWVAFGCLSEGDVEETCGPRRDLWVWETDAWAYGAAHWVKLCVISFMFSPPLLRGNTTWEVAYLLDGWYVWGTICCALGTDLWVWKTGAFVLSDVVYWHQPCIS